MPENIVVYALRYKVGNIHIQNAAGADLRGGYGVAVIGNYFKTLGEGEEKRLLLPGDIFHTFVATTDGKLGVA